MSRRVSGDDDIIDDTTLIETACKVYYLSQWRNKEDFLTKKRIYQSKKRVY